MAGRLRDQHPSQRFDHRERTEMVAQRVVVADKEPPQVVGRRCPELLPVGSMCRQQIDVGDFQCVEVVDHRLVESTPGVNELLDHIAAVGEHEQDLATGAGFSN